MTNIIVITAIVLKELIRRKDAYVLLILTALLTILAGSVHFFSDLNMVRYMKELCLLLVWISSVVIAVTLTARQIPSERETRTLFSLLSKPVSRNHVVFGKFLGCWLACGVALLAFYSFFIMSAVLRGEHWRLPENFQAFWMHWVMLGVTVAMVLCGSLIFTAPSSNATINFAIILGILMLGRHLAKIALHLGEPAQSVTLAIFYAMPHLEFYDLRDLIIHDWPAVKWSAIGLATLYGVAYSAAFLGLACFLFRRKPLNG